MKSETPAPQETTGRHRLGDMDSRAATALQAGGGLTAVVAIVMWLANDIRELDANVARLGQELRDDVAELNESVAKDLAGIREDVVDVRLDVQAMKSERAPTTSSRR